MSTGMRRSLSTVAVLLTLVISVAAQDSSVGRELYARASGDVFLLKVSVATGEDVALASGFLIGKGKILTNAHVVNKGAVYVQFGSVRVATTLERIDAVNDLALLSIAADVTVEPLKLAASDPRPGETVFAITNPEGLEKTISQGVVSAARIVDGHPVLQITAPISHGSSGGPILNSAGEVVGVAVGTIAEGQNLNFAVPASVVRAFLASPASTNKRSVEDLLKNARRVSDEQGQEKYSQDAVSPWQAKERELKGILNNAYEAAGTNVPLLADVAQSAQAMSEYGVAVQAADRAYQLRPDTETRLALSQVLNASVIFEQDDNIRVPALARSETLARTVVDGNKKPTTAMYDRLANVLEDEGKHEESLRYFRLVLATASPSERPDFLRGIVRQSTDDTEVDRAFGALQKELSLNGYDWRTRGKWLDGRKRFSEAGTAYALAAQLSHAYTDWCEAAGSAFLANNEDNSLTYSRTCIEQGSTKKGAEASLKDAHYIIGNILVRRGVYAEALSHAQDSIALGANKGPEYSVLAKALLGLQRSQEAIIAATEAIRLSDGKYAADHFDLGRAYFKTENWQLAVQSFEKAAELDKQDTAAPYNVALCYIRLGYNRDAATWYEEVLRRNPNYPEKADLQERIKALRK